MSRQNKEQIKQMERHLGRLRAWFEGFAAAGGRPPNCTDALRQAQIFIQDNTK